MQGKKIKALTYCYVFFHVPCCSDDSLAAKHPTAIKVFSRAISKLVNFYTSV